MDLEGNNASELKKAMQQKAEEAFADSVDKLMAIRRGIQVLGADIESLDEAIYIAGTKAIAKYEKVIKTEEDAARLMIQLIHDETK